MLPAAPKGGAQTSLGEKSIYSLLILTIEDKFFWTANIGPVNMVEGAEQQEVCYKMETNELLDMGNTKLVQGSYRWPEEILFSCEIEPI